MDVRVLCEVGTSEIVFVYPYALRSLRTTTGKLLRVSNSQMTVKRFRQPCLLLVSRANIAV
jgi:hypothetical protein